VTATPVSSDRRHDLFFWLTAIAVALPLLVVEHAPFTDLPEHVAAMATMAKLLPGGGGAPYVVAFGSSQYLVYHAVGGVLTRIVGDALLANRILLAAVAIAWPLSLRSLLRAHGRDERVAIFGSMLVWNRALLVGFLPFVASVPIALFALATVVRQLEAATRRRAVILAVLSLTLFYTHVSSFVLFALSACAMIAVRRVNVVATAAPLVPSAIAAALWWRAGSLEGARGRIEVVMHMPIAASLHALPAWTFDIWTSHVDDLCAGVWWTAFGVLLAIGLRRDARLFTWIPFVCTLGVYLVTPVQLGAAGLLNVRLAPLLALFALPGAAVDGVRVTRLATTAAGIVAIVMAVSSGFEMRRLEREQLGDIESVLSHARPGSRLVTLDLEARTGRMVFWPYVFAGSLHRLHGGRVASYSFSELPHWPLHYAPGEAPPAKQVPLAIYAPCTYRYRADGDYYDYVLVQGRTNPFADPTPGPPFTAIAHAGAFTLFGKTGGAADEWTPDRGPCEEEKKR
jgi:hypothetical protein